MARVLVLDVLDTRTVYETECNDLDDYYKALKCKCFDIAYRNIGGQHFDIYCDDNGLFAEEPVPSAFGKPLFSQTFEPMLVGNLVFANHDSQGNTTSLTDDDIKLIKDNIILIRIPHTEDFYPAVICQPDL